MQRIYRTKWTYVYIQTCAKNINAMFTSLSLKKHSERQSWGNILNVSWPRIIKNRSSPVRAHNYPDNRIWTIPYSQCRSPSPMLREPDQRKRHEQLHLKSVFDTTSKHVFRWILEFAHGFTQTNFITFSG